MRLTERQRGIYIKLNIAIITKENEMELLVVKNRGVTTVGIQFHEKIRGLNYYMLSDYTGNSNLRELQKMSHFIIGQNFMQNI